jgi:hypothetical protein
MAACQKLFLPDNKTMSAQEILIEEIRHQPEIVAQEVLHYLKFIERQRELETPMDSLVADTWEKLGPSPEVYPPQRRDALPRQTITVKLPT